MNSSSARARAVIFDLDGLLVDSEPTWFAVEGGFLADLGHLWTRQAAEACMGQGTPNTLRIWRETFGVDVDIQRDTDRIIDRVIGRANEMPLMVGALEMLDLIDELGLPKAVASSSPRRLIEAVLTAKGILHRFDVIQSAQEVARTKPAPDVFLRAAELLSIPAGECLVLEDAVSGVRGARAAGAIVVAVPTVHDPVLRELADAVVSNLLEAAGVVRSFAANGRTSG